MYMGTFKQEQNSGRTQASEDSCGWEGRGWLFLWQGVRRGGSKAEE